MDTDRLEHAEARWLDRRIPDAAGRLLHASTRWVGGGVVCALAGDWNKYSVSVWSNRSTTI